MASQAKPSNGFKPEDLKSYINRVENVKRDIASKTGSFMKEIRDLRDDIKDILTEAKENGVPVKPLKAELKLRDLDREKEKIVENLEEDDAETLEQIRFALGDYASLPLGEAVMEKAAARK
jgi:uncharacterized protein (UPF0335 family)